MWLLLLLKDMLFSLGLQETKMDKKDLIDLLDISFSHKSIIMGAYT